MSDRNKAEAAILHGNDLNTYEFLDWLADRLVHVYGESPNVDFVLSCRERARVLREAMTDEQGLFPVGPRRVRAAKELYASLGGGEAEL